VRVQRVELKSFDWEDFFVHFVARVFWTLVARSARGNFLPNAVTPIILRRDGIEYQSTRFIDFLASAMPNEIDDDEKDDDFDEITNSYGMPDTIKLLLCDIHITSFVGFSPVQENMA